MNWSVKIDINGNQSIILEIDEQSMRQGSVTFHRFSSIIERKRKSNQYLPIYGNQCNKQTVLCDYRLITNIGQCHNQHWLVSIHRLVFQWSIFINCVCWAINQSEIFVFYGYTGLVQMMHQSSPTPYTHYSKMATMWDELGRVTWKRGNKGQLCISCRVYLCMMEWLFLKIVVCWLKTALKCCGIIAPSHTSKHDRICIVGPCCLAFMLLSPAHPVR